MTVGRTSKHVLGFIVLLLAALALPASAQQNLGLNNNSGDDDFKGTIGRTDQDSRPYFPPPLRPKAGSPNIVYIVLDDVGFSDLAVYGSEIHTPNIDRLALEGLRYNNFHTRAICSPTRAALLTGRNSHSVGVRTVADLLNGFPNDRGRISPHATTLAEILRDAGYSTFALGKWHLVPGAQSSDAGPFENWPLQKGFEHYYGFLGGATDQYHPDLVQDNSHIDPPRRADYHLSEDLIDHSITYLRNQQTVTPDKPFFLYLAFGAAHAPHQVPQRYIDKYVPVFEKGWDQTREDRIARQKKLGIIPPNTELAPRNEGIKPWDSLSADEKRLFVRYQAAYAGFLEHADEQIGRLVDFLRDAGQLDNTILVLISDNGANPEGGFEGWTNYVYGYGSLSGVIPAKSTFADDLKHINDIGTDRSTTNYPRGWAMAGNTPFKLYKEYVHAGGVNDPLIIHWPKGISDRGAIRHQFVDVIDITPTILEVTGLKAPENYHGIAQKPIEGTSIAATLREAAAPEVRRTQYFEQLGHRAIWNDGWKLVAEHKAGTDFDSDKWELYNISEDFSETRDLSATYPEKTEQLKKLWWSEADKYGVLPLDGRGLTRLVSAQSAPQRTNWTFYPGQPRIPVRVIPLAKQDFGINARVNRSSSSSNGILLSVGDGSAGYVFYIKNNKLIFDNNNLGTHQVLASTAEVPIGESDLRFEFTAGKDFNGKGALLINSEKTAESELTISPAVVAFGALEVGKNSLSPVSRDYADQGSFAFPDGELKKVDFSITPLPLPSKVARTNPSSSQAQVNKQ
ncbi:MAG TPA: arylsulfatase [Terriglobales bacterium]|nr:arylsulfatase [Terriglobales bacterium]